MTVYVAGFRTLSDARHVAAHTFCKSVNRVGSGLVDHFMTRETLCLTTGFYGLRHVRCPGTPRPIQFNLFKKVGVGIVTEQTGHTFFSVNRFGPVDVLLMMAFGEFIWFG